ncbi:hypothetical protein [Anaerosphaera multitolerans]|uniref:Uncharacterized protein n=1 Tax=Anaerosphaera multitolerans TaxID=2487351 RepID=A0A437S5F5_9FIRM|nr:hypothetical protein [Anaerosphaera multitolerans]RVU54253.1 hypothetical protein EF514_08095 [Anaerosphaera multitolerans]
MNGNINNLLVGIKYCGGCQSKYNRSELFTKIKESYPNVDFQYVKENVRYNFIIVISGCHIKCAEVKNYIGINGVVNLDDNNYLQYIELIDNLLKKNI